MPKLETSIASIETKLDYIQRDIGEIKNCMKTQDDRTTAVEQSVVEVKTKLGIFAGVQAVFSIAVGAISGYFKS